MKDLLDELRPTPAKGKPQKKLALSLQMEERLAARAFLYNWDTYVSLSGSEKCHILVAYRILNVLEGIKSGNYD